jgi:hypothetical protein
MTNLIAIAPKEGKISSYLTNGKEYPIIEWNKKTKQNRANFCIIDDDGEKIYCTPIGSAHLTELNWTIIEQP